MIKLKNFQRDYHNMILIKKYMKNSMNAQESDITVLRDVCGIHEDVVSLTGKIKFNTGKPKFTIFESVPFHAQILKSNIPYKLTLILRVKCEPTAGIYPDFLEFQQYLRNNLFIENLEIRFVSTI